MRSQDIIPSSRPSFVRKSVPYKMLILICYVVLFVVFNDPVTPGLTNSLFGDVFKEFWRGILGVFGTIRGYVGEMSSGKKQRRQLYMRKYCKKT